MTPSSTVTEYETRNRRINEVISAIKILSYGMTDADFVQALSHELSIRRLVVMDREHVSALNNFVSRMSAEVYSLNNIKNFLSSSLNGGFSR
jgi:hypothetical protein